MSAPAPRAVPLRRWLPVAVACLLGAALPAGLVILHRRIAPRENPAAERYNELVRGFEAGHLYLQRPVPAALASLPDPYDSSANQEVRGGLDRLLDLSYYRGRLYLYFGVVPALVAFLPWHWATGHWLSESAALAAFSAVGFLSAAALLIAVWRRHFPEAGPGLVAGCTLLLGTASTVPLIAARAHVWEVTVAGAYAMAMPALGAGWLACQARGRGARLGWLAATGLFAGLTVGCRANLAFATAWVVAAAAWGASRSPTSPASRSPVNRDRILAFLSAFGGLGVVGAGLAWYNWARFGDPLQFGQHYQLASDNVHSRTVFSAAFLVENTRLYFLSALRWGTHFPFAWLPAVPPLSPAHGDAEDVVGAFAAAPALLLAAAVPLAWRGRLASEKAFLRGCAAGLAGYFLLSAAVLLFFYGACNRYEVDFLPGLTLLACLGVLGADRAAGARTPVPRAAGRGLTGMLLAYSVAAMTLCSIARCEYSAWREVEAARMIGTAPDDTALAIEAGRKLTVLSNGFDGYTSLGLAQLKAGNRADAARSFSEAIHLAPADFPAEYSLGMLEIGNNALDSGFGHLLDALQRHPGNTAYEGNAGLILVSAGRDRDAIPLLQDALRTHPAPASLQAALGKALVRTGSVAAALPCLREAVRLDPANADTQNDLGVALYESGKRAAAATHFAEALRLDPDLPGVRRNLAAAKSGP